MSDELQKWLESDVRPADIYQLLARPRFYPDCKRMRQLIREYNRTLHQYQHHSDPKVIQRARQLQMMLGEADNAFSSEHSQRTYEDTLFASLQRDYVAHSGGSESAWRFASVRRWLEMVQRVHATRLDELTRRLVESAPRASAGSSPVAPTAAAPQSRQQQLFGDKASVPQANRRVGDSHVRMTAVPASRRPNSSHQMPVMPPLTPTPPPISRLPTSGAVGTPPHGMAVVPSAGLPTAVSTSGAMRALPGGPPQRTTASERRSTGLLWVIGSAVISALVILLLGLAWLRPGLLNRSADEGTHQALMWSPDTMLPVREIEPRIGVHGAI